MRCTNQITITKGLNRAEYPHGLQVPCGKCIACRIHKRQEWTLRLMHELTNWENSVFVTFTYSPETIPPHNSLKKKTSNSIGSVLEKTQKENSSIMLSVSTVTKPNAHIITLFCTDSVQKNTKCFIKTGD